MLFDCNHSASPPGGNQVDGLPPALHFENHEHFQNIDAGERFMPLNS